MPRSTISVVTNLYLTWHHYSRKNAKLIAPIIGVTGIIVAIVGIIVTAVITILVK